VKEVIKLKHICTTLLIFSLLFVLVGCATRGPAVEDLVGVWRTENYEEEALGWASNSFAAVYITADGNLYVLLTTDSTAGPWTTVYPYYYYEIVDNQLVLTPMENDLRRDVEAIQISIENNSMQLDMQEVYSSSNPQAFLFTLYHYTDELPYGWTNADRQEMQETMDWARNQILAFAEQFSEELGLPVLPRGTRGEATSTTFSIEDISVDIVFRGQLPTPIYPRWHTHMLGLTDYDDGEWRSARSAHGRFSIRWHQRHDLPEEWLDIFVNLDDLPE